VHASLDDRLQVSGDPFLLQRAIVNLLRNAVEFTSQGSSVEIDVEEEGGSARLTVRDHGPGVPDFARDRIFDKFFSLPRPDSGRKGTGLGLAFVREVAALHGGGVRLVNHPGGGALATLTLPRLVSRWAVR
jgi:two-component system sensor histidine kinase CreC